MLGVYRALDLNDEKGFICGKALADLGAGVVKIEPPGGDPARNMGLSTVIFPLPRKASIGLRTMPTNEVSP